MTSPHLTVLSLLVSVLSNPHSLQLIVHINTQNQTTLHSHLSLPPPSPSKCNCQCRHMSSQPPHPRVACQFKPSCSVQVSFCCFPNSPRHPTTQTTCSHTTSTLHHTRTQLLHTPDTQHPTLSSHASLREADGVPCTRCKYLELTENFSYIASVS